jgi:hypothetical protein
MGSNRIFHLVIVTCLLGATALLGGCSPPIPKTSLPPPDGTMLIDRVYAVGTSSLTP